MIDVEKWLSYKGTCHVILLAKLHDMYLYKTDNFFHINHCLKSVSKVAVLYRFYCIPFYIQIEYDPASLQGTTYNRVFVTANVKGRYVRYQSSVAYNMMDVATSARNIAVELWRKWLQ